jgi:hypothetical protein
MAMRAIGLGVAARVTLRFTAFQPQPLGYLLSGWVCYRAYDIFMGPANR